MIELEISSPHEILIRSVVFWGNFSQVCVFFPKFLLICSILLKVGWENRV